MADQSPHRVSWYNCRRVAIDRSATRHDCVAATAIAPEQRGRWLQRLAAQFDRPLRLLPR